MFLSLSHCYHESPGPKTFMYTWLKILFPTCLCMKFSQLFLRKITEIGTTMFQILGLKCTKFDFGWDSLCIHCSTMHCS